MPNTSVPGARPSRPPIPSFRKLLPSRYGWIGGPGDAPVILWVGRVNDLLMAQVLWFTFADRDGTPAVATANIISNPIKHDGSAISFQPGKLQRGRLGWNGQNHQADQVTVDLGHDPAITIGSVSFELRPAMITEISTPSAGTIKQVTEDLQTQWSPGLPFLHSYILLRRGSGWAWDLGLADVERGIVEFRRPVADGGAVEPTFTFPLSDLTQQGFLP